MVIAATAPPTAAPVLAVPSLPAAPQVKSAGDPTAKVQANAKVKPAPKSPVPPTTPAAPLAAANKPADATPRRHRKYRNVAAVVSGLFVFYATCTLSSSFLLVLSSAMFEGVAWYILCYLFAAFFAGYFVATVANSDKVRHAIYAGALICLAILIYLICLAIEIGSVVEGIIVYGACIPLYFLATVCGGLLHQKTLAFLESRFPRRQWHFKTSAGQDVLALDPWRHPSVALCWRIIGWTFIATCWVHLVDWQDMKSQKGGFQTLISAVILGKVCLIIAKRNSQRSARQELGKDKRPPIVFLRSFSDDGKTTDDSFWTQLNQGIRALASPTLEEHLHGVLKGFGPFVAIGIPNEQLPPLGAARMYVNDDSWQHVVTDLIDRPGTMVVFQAGATKGLRWELHEVVKDLRPEQVVVFLPFVLTYGRKKRDLEYAAFRSWAQEYLPAPLPEEIGTNCFLFFGKTPAWRTYVLERQLEVPRRHFLAEVLEKLQESKKFRPKSNVRFYVLLAILASLILLALFCGLAGYLHNLFTTPAQNQNPVAAPVQPAPPQETLPVVPKKGTPGATTYLGKQFPYRLVLGPEWVRVKDADPNVDLHLQRGDLHVLIFGWRERDDLDSFPDTFAKQLRDQKIEDTDNNVFDKVTLVRRGKERIRGKEWLDFKVELVAQKSVSWNQLRGYSGPEGTLILRAVYGRDDAEIRVYLAEVLDAIEILPSP